MQHVLLIGHSFLRRLDMPPEGFDLNYGLTGIEWCEYIRNTPLNTVDQLEMDLDVLHQNFVRPDLVIIVLGTNDLCSKPL